MSVDSLLKGHLNQSLKTLEQDNNSAEVPANRTEDLLEQNANELSKPPSEELPDAEKQTAMADYYFEVGF